jgi:GTPase
VLSFVDLAGHEKYLKTTVFGMTGSAPEFAMLMVTQITDVFTKNVNLVTFL